MLNTVVRALAGIAIVGFTTALAGCDGVGPSFSDAKGVPLAELDLAGIAPTSIALRGPDNVRVTRGDKLTVTVVGEGADKLRFTLDEGELSVLRDDWKMGTAQRAATVNVTLPLLSGIVLAGSGNLITDQLAGSKAKIFIAGSGTVEARAIDANELDVALAGVGKLKAGGKAKELKVSIAGSGDAEMDGLNADTVSVDVAGSGNARFASNGNVTGNILGSGEVRVFGRAKCQINSIGSGKMVCENGVVAGAEQSQTAKEP